jgi:hypothetical protein
MARAEVLFDRICRDNGLRRACDDVLDDVELNLMRPEYLCPGQQGEGLPGAGKHGRHDRQPLRFAAGLPEVDPGHLTDLLPAVIISGGADQGTSLLSGNTSLLQLPPTRESVTCVYLRGYPARLSDSHERQDLQITPSHAPVITEMQIVNGQPVAQELTH